MEVALAEYRLPWYARFTVILIGISIIIIALYLGREIFVPLAFAALVSVLLYPLSNLLERLKVPRLLAIFISVMIASIVLLGLAAVIALQVGQFGEDLPRIQEKSVEHVARAQEYLLHEWGISYKEQLRWFEQWGSQAFERGGEIVGQALLTFMDIATLVILVPLFAFLLLMYKDLIIGFVFTLIARRSTTTLVSVLHETRGVVKNYVVGLIVETVIIAILNCIALLLLGVDHAILFGVLAALLNLIPYIGIVVGGMLPMLMAFITKDSVWYPLGVAASFSVIQLIDNNLIVPYFVAARVRINALVSIVAVIFGGMLWGMSGMFLSLPAVAILKIIFDRVESLKPWGVVLGDAIPIHRKGKAAKP